MKKTLKLRDSLTYEIIGDLFFHPPVNDAELSQRMESVDLTTARRLVIDRLDHGTLPDQAGPLFLAILGKLGIGRQKQRLIRIALDLGRPSRDRLWAAIVLSNNDPRIMEKLVSKLGPEGMGYLAELSLFELLAVQDDKDIGSSIAEALEDIVDERSLKDLLNKIEMCRLNIGASCAVAYGDALCKEALIPIRRAMLAFFVQEGSDEGSTLLAALRDRATDDTARKDFQAALLRLYSKRIVSDRVDEAPQGYAWVSNCDAQGGFFILGVFEDDDETLSVVDLFLHAGGDVCDGAVYPSRNVVEVGEIKRNMERELGCLFVEVTLAEAAKLIEINHPGMALKRQTVSGDTGRAVGLFDRVVGAFSWGEGSCCPPVAAVYSSDVAKLMERPEYEDTWVFEAGDFDDEDDSSIRFRLVAMAEHMARFHFWAGEKKEAALCRALAAGVRQDFSRRSLLRTILLRSSAVYDDP
jgi:hypothetical protein